MRRRHNEIFFTAPTFGYGDDLMYFEDLFRALQDEYSEIYFDVRDHFPLSRYPDLHLNPVLRTRVISLPGFRSVAGVRYERRVLRLPDPRAILALFRRPLAAQFVIEFSPVSTMALVIAWMRRKPSVLFIESDPTFRGGNQTRLNLLRKRLLSRMASLVVTNNAEGAAWARDHLKLGQDKLIVTPYLTSYPRASRGEIQPELRPDVEELLFVNSVTERKGIFVLLDALAACGEAPRAHQLTVVGAGEDLEAAQQRAETLGLDDRVTFVGRVPYDELSRFYRTADVVVVPTQADYRSLAGIEAVNHGRALIASARDGAALELARLSSGVVVVEPTVSHVARVLRRILSDDAFRDSLKTAARSSESSLSPERVAGGVFDAIRERLAVGRLAS